MKSSAADATKTSMDRAGRLIIPSQVRRASGIVPGAPLVVRWRDGRIEIEPAPRAVKLVKKGRFLVAVPVEPGPALSRDTVERVRDELRSERS